MRYPECTGEKIKIHESGGNDMENIDKKERLYSNGFGSTWLFVRLLVVVSAVILLLNFLY
jgi:hypothetical protein